MNFVVLSIFGDADEIGRFTAHKFDQQTFLQADINFYNVGPPLPNPTIADISQAISQRVQFLRHGSNDVLLDLKCAFLTKHVATPYNALVEFNNQMSHLKIEEANALTLAAAATIGTQTYNNWQQILAAARNTLQQLLANHDDHALNREIMMQTENGENHLTLRDYIQAVVANQVPIVHGRLYWKKVYPNGSVSIYTNPELDLADSLRLNIGHMVYKYRDLFEKKWQGAHPDLIAYTSQWDTDNWNSVHLEGQYVSEKVGEERKDLIYNTDSGHNHDCTLFVGFGERVKALDDQFVCRISIIV